MKNMESGVLYTPGDVVEDAEGVYREVVRHTYLPQSPRLLLDFSSLALRVESGALVLSDGTHPMRRGDLRGDDRAAFLSELVRRWNEHTPEER